MNEVAGFRAGNVFAARSPANFADTCEHIGDRLLLTMMMDAGACSRLDLEQPGPQ